MPRFGLIIRPIEAASLSADRAMVRKAMLTAPATINLAGVESIGLIRLVPIGIEHNGWVSRLAATGSVTLLPGERWVMLLVP